MSSDPRTDASPSTQDDNVLATSLDYERELVAALLRKDRKAAAEFVERYADAIYSYVRHRLTPRLERVDDVVQDVFVAALGSLPAFRGSAPLRTWLLGIARHKVEDYYRRELRKPEPLAEPETAGEPPDEEPPIEDRIDRARAVDRTQRVLRRMPPVYSMVLLWRYWENRSVREMADATGKTEKAVERLLARARACFRELWIEVSHG